MKHHNEHMSDTLDEEICDELRYAVPASLPAPLSKHALKLPEAIKGRRKELKRVEAINIIKWELLNAQRARQDDMMKRENQVQDAETRAAHRQSEDSAFERANQDLARQKSQCGVHRHQAGPLDDSNCQTNHPPRHRALMSTFDQTGAYGQCTASPPLQHTMVGRNLNPTIPQLLKTTAHDKKLMLPPPTSQHATSVIRSDNAEAGGSHRTSKLDRHKTTWIRGSGGQVGTKRVPRTFHPPSTSEQTSPDLPSNASIATRGKSEEASAVSSVHVCQNQHIFNVSPDVPTLETRIKNSQAIDKTPDPMIVSSTAQKDGSNEKTSILAASKVPPIRNTAIRRRDTNRTSQAPEEGKDASGQGRSTEGPKAFTSAAGNQVIQAQKLTAEHDKKPAEEKSHEDGASDTIVVALSSTRWHRERRVKDGRRGQRTRVELATRRAQHAKRRPPA